MGPRRIRLSAPAKVNLFLGVHEGRDERGYHRVDSVMSAVSLADEVSLCEAPSLSLACDPEVDCPPERNAAWRAAALLAEALCREPSVSIEITKRIPSQSGMGGASTDAAAVLVGLCELWGEPRTSERVLAVARVVGADVPFFLYESPALLVGGGDVLEEAFPPLPELPIVIARPQGAGVTAAGAYAEFDRGPVPAGSLDAIRAVLREGDGADAATRLAAVLSNNLDPVARRLLPEAGEVAELMAGMPGVLRSMVTGSGSCSYALCEGDSVFEEVVRTVRAHGWWAEPARLVRRCVEVLERNW